MTTPPSHVPHAVRAGADITTDTSTARSGDTLDVAALTAAAGNVTILHGVDACVPVGAVAAIVGPNGSGKSTLLRVLIGALPADTGAVLLSGRDLRRMTRRERARHLALVEQDSSTDVSRDVLDVVLLGRTPHLPRWATDSPGDVEIAREALVRAGAAALADRDFASLSGGERQRVHLARALAQEPRVLLLDEPTNHLDVGAQLAVLSLTRTVTAGGGTVLAALHDLNHALRFCDHVLVLERGRVVAAGHPAVVLTEELVSRVYGVRAHRVSTGGRDILLFDPAEDGVMTST